jgi:hypothetical protein
MCCCACLAACVDRGRIRSMQICFRICVARYDGARSGDWIAFVVICVSCGGSTVSLLMGSGDHNATKSWHALRMSSYLPQIQTRLILYTIGAQGFVRLFQNPNSHLQHAPRCVRMHPDAGHAQQNSLSAPPQPSREKEQAVISLGSKH